VGRFEIIRPLRLLDVEALREIFVKGSVFDPNHRSALARAKFLGTLSRRITQPVMPDDELFEYLPTQVVAEFLSAKLGLDGTIYPSVQRDGGGANVVLFRKSSGTEPQPLPAGAEIEADLEMHTEDGVEVDYRVWAKVPIGDPRPKEKVAIQSLDITQPVEDFWDNSMPPRPSLRLDFESVEVCNASRLYQSPPHHTESRDIELKRACGKRVENQSDECGGRRALVCFSRGQNDESASP
jgi:hypothetical protein